MGQVVELFGEGVLTAYVVKIQEGGLMDERGHPQPAVLIIQAGIPFEMEAGVPMPVYIVKEPDPMGIHEAPAKKGRKAN